MVRVALKKYNRMDWIVTGYICQTLVEKTEATLVISTEEFNQGNPVSHVMEDLWNEVGHGKCLLGMVK